MKEINIANWNHNAFTLFDKDWGLVTTGTSDAFNTMTISWGSLGILWNKKIVTIYIRPTRYTYKFMESNDYFTLSFYTENYKDTLFMLGTKSGKEYPKVKESKLHPIPCQESITFKEAKCTLLCKKIYHYDISPLQFQDPTLDKNYPKLDYHRAYIGEIIAIYE